MSTKQICDIGRERRDIGLVFSNRLPGEELSVTAGTSPDALQDIAALIVADDE